MFKKMLVPLMLVAVLLLSACAKPTAAPTEMPKPPATPEPATGLAAPTGAVILTVTGDIADPNVGGECHFDADLFDEYAVEQTLDDPWMGDGLEYRGLLLSDIWELCGGATGAEVAALIAEDGMTIEIAAADLQEWPIMVAYQVNGEDLIADLGGPVKMVYPAAAGDAYGDDMWMWWLAEIRIGASTAPEALPAPTGDVILTVTGDLEIPNVGDECQFDAELFDQYAITQDLDDPWMGDGLDYRGLTLARIWELCGAAAGAEVAALVAEDGMTIEIAAADLQEWPIMVAYQVGGEDLIADLGGPVKVVYPAEAGDTYGDDQWMWWLAEIQIGASTAPEALPAPTGDVILVVTGDLEIPNVGDECQFDVELFDQYAITQDLDDPWMGDGLDYRGLTLARIWELCGAAADAEVAALVAEDGMTIEIAAADLQEWPIMVAYQVNGEDLISDLGGPVKMVYPAEAGDTYGDDTWMWWLAEIQIGASTALEALPAPTGDVILVVTGDLEIPNVGDECQFDADLFDQYAITQDLDDPWMGDGLDYRGLTLARIWELCGAADDAEVAALVAKDGMTIEIAAADLQEWPIMVAYQVGGEDLIDDLGGPVKMVYPADAGDTYGDDMWMWWLAEIQIGASTAPEVLAAPTGDVILIVTGDLESPNVGDECQFDADLFDQYAITQDLDDPWMGDGLDYRGLTLARIWELCGAADDAEVATLVAEDGMTIEIAAADLQEWPIMVAYQVGGEGLIDDIGGPIKMVYPADAADTYGDDMWMWWLAEIQIH